MLPKLVRIHRGPLPDRPGVYLMKDAHGQVLYIGKATSLSRRVQQHFQRPHNALIEDMTTQVRKIEYFEAQSALDALILEANLIKEYWPPYNTAQKDDTSFMYLALTDEVYPKPLLIRGSDLATGKTYKRVFGPYTSSRALRTALDVVRRAIPWSTCDPHQADKKHRPCFYVHLGQCPGVCTGAITPSAYDRIVRDLIKLFSGQRLALLRAYQGKMQRAARLEHFEEAAVWRNKVQALEHIRDIALLKRDDEAWLVQHEEQAEALTHRIEGYDISHISGTSTVASMVVFDRGAMQKSSYRRFHVHSVKGSDDLAALREVLHRRWQHHDWPKPSLVLIDGGLSQVHAVEVVWREVGLNIPLLGMAKGVARKRNDLIFSSFVSSDLRSACLEHAQLLAHVRDEAHRFAITFHRKTRDKRGLIK